MAELKALDRLIARSALDHVRQVESLYDTLRSRRVPAVLNKTDYTIGFKAPLEQVERALGLMGFHKGKNGIMEDGTTTIRLVEPREDWHPVLQVI